VRGRRRLGQPTTGGTWYRTSTSGEGTRYFRSRAGVWFLDWEDGGPLVPVKALGEAGRLFSPEGMDVAVTKGELREETAP
jgi:hypothetical protein